METTVMRVLVVDDHEIVRRGIRAILASEGTLVVCGEAVDGLEAVEKTRILQPDVVVMDISMPNLNGLDATRLIKQGHPEVQVIIVSQHETNEIMDTAREAGASAYVTKSAVSTDLLKAILPLQNMQSASQDIGASASGATGIPKNLTDRDRPREKALRNGDERFPSETETLGRRVPDQTQKSEEATAQLRDLSGKLLRAQDEERRRIARELHDGVGQLLTALKMNLAGFDAANEFLSADAKHSLDDSAKLVEEALREIRTVSYLLHPPMLDEVGLESALRWYIDGFSERSKIAVRLELDSGILGGLPRDLALALFRIIQECLTNVHRHSGSTTALVKLTRFPDRIRVEVQDQGKGMPAEIQAKISSGDSVGVGLRGMRERIRQFGGRVDISSNPLGTQIKAELPISNQVDEQQFSESNRTSSEPIQAGATILCIDDEVAGLWSRKLLLESAGHRVIEARSGAEGIRLFQSYKIDLVVLDYWMSGMKGTAIASELKRINSAVPIIVLSGMSDLPGEASGLVDQWLVKGHDGPEQLLNSIRTLLRHQTVVRKTPAYEPTD